jgi:pimeloyl-ACP methyl ester carboxylesterase
MAVHVAGLLGVLDDAAVRRAALVGHSMGAFVIARLAAERPERAGDAVLGPAIARLRMTFASMQEYVAVWQAHPALRAAGPKTSRFTCARSPPPSI